MWIEWELTPKSRAPQKSPTTWTSNGPNASQAQSRPPAPVPGSAGRPSLQTHLGHAFETSTRRTAISMYAASRRLQIDLADDDDEETISKTRTSTTRTTTTIRRRRGWGRRGGRGDHDITSILGQGPLGQIAKMLGIGFSPQSGRPQRGAHPIRSSHSQAQQEASSPPGNPPSAISTTRRNSPSRRRPGGIASVATGSPGTSSISAKREQILLGHRPDAAGADEEWRALARSSD